MEFTIDFGAWNGVFAVPCGVVDKHLKLAGESSLKVLLWILRHAGKPVNSNTIASELSLSRADTEDCIFYWVKAGIFSLTDNMLEPKQEHSSITPPKTETASPSSARETRQPTYQVIKADKAPQLEPEAWAERLEGEDVRFLFHQAENILGHAPTPMEQKELVDLLDWFAFPLDSVLMLLQYCKTTKRRGVRSIHAVAMEWVKEGISSYEQVEEYISRRLVQYDHENEVRDAFHLRDGLSEKQKKFIANWFGPLGFTIDMVKLAGDRTLDRTNSLSFDYMNSILESWSKKGISTPKQAMEEKKPQQQSFTAGSASSLDKDEIDRLFAYGTIDTKGGKE